MSNTFFCFKILLAQSHLIPLFYVDTLFIQIITNIVLKILNHYINYFELTNILVTKKMFLQ